MKSTISIQSRLHTDDISGKRVFLRADLNVPIEKEKPINDHKLQALLPTIDLIQKKGAKVILATHIGRPQQATPSLSTKQFVPWFEKQGYAITFEPDLNKAKNASKEQWDKILFLENLRFFPGEKNHAQTFVKELAQLCDYYVNDAFGIVHRSDSSVTDLPKQLPPENRTIGLLIEGELLELNKLLASPQRPFLLIVGGAKIKIKLPLISSFVGHADGILLCPAIVFTVLKALGQPVGKSLIDENLLAASKKILQAAKEANTRLIFPVDYQIAQNSFDGQTSHIDSTIIPNTAVGVSIGPKTEKLFAQEIMKAGTVFFNGAIGNLNRKETLEGMHSILRSMAQSKATTVIAGGDSVAVAQQFGLAKKFDFCSTGGGATLTYLAGKDLPGLEEFI